LSRFDQAIVLEDSNIWKFCIFISHHFSFTFHLSSHFIIAMMLAFSFKDRTFDDLKDLLLYLNQHADSEDYAIVLKRTKKFKLQVTCKTWIICDRNKKSHERAEEHRRHDSSRHIKCSFFIIAKLDDENVDLCIFEIRNEEHNHVSSMSDAHSVLRQMTMTKEIKNEIKRQLKI
jgi:hypothetical protein